MSDLTKKKYGLTLGMAIYPNEVQPLTAGPLYYGKLNYEAMVQVQTVVAKHQQSFVEAMQPMVEELMAMGILQAQVVTETRKETPKVNPSATR